MKKNNYYLQKNQPHKMVGRMKVGSFKFYFYYAHANMNIELI